MLQAQEIQKRFNQVEQTIHHAAQVCQSASGVPMDLKDTIQQMDQASGQARQLMQGQDQQQMIESVDRLEALSDRARDACEKAGNVDSELKDAVIQAHRELSDLKHQLH